MRKIGFFVGYTFLAMIIAPIIPALFLPNLDISGYFDLLVKSSMLDSSAFGRLLGQGAIFWIIAFPVAWYFARKHGTRKSQIDNPEAQKEDS